MPVTLEQIRKARELLERDCGPTDEPLYLALPDGSIHRIPTGEWWKGWKTTNPPGWKPKKH